MSKIVEVIKVTLNVRNRMYGVCGDKFWGYWVNYIQF